MILDFSLELQVVEGKNKDVKNQLKKKQEGKRGIIS